MNENDPITNPIITVTVERMRHQVYHMLSQYHLNLDEQLKSAVDIALKADRVQAILNETAILEVNRIVKEETEHFFRYGEGHKAIAQSIEKVLINKITPKKKKVTK